MEFSTLPDDNPWQGIELAPRETAEEKASRLEIELGILHEQNRMLWKTEPEAGVIDDLVDLTRRRMYSNPNFKPEHLIAAELETIKAREQAKKLYAQEQTKTGYAALEIKDLAQLYLEDDAPLEWRIQGLMQIGHNVTVAARYKVGKTTLITNLLRSLVDGQPFLDEFPVKQLERPVVVFNHELSDRQFTAWLRKARITNAGLVIPVNLRGKGLYLQDEAAQEWAIEILRKYDAEMWIVDPLQAALRGSVNDDTVASEWISAADRVKDAAGVSELMLVTHTGHLSKADEYGQSSNERSAGSARWSGWPDALWSYTKDDEGIRYIRAEGRDIDVDERALSYNEEFARLSSKGDGTSRRDEKADRPFHKLMAEFAAAPERVLTRPDIERLTRMNNKDVTTAIRDAESASLIEECETVREPGSRGRAPKSYRVSGYGNFYLKRYSRTTDN